MADIVEAQLLGRIRLIRAALWEVYPQSMATWVEGFERDARPEDEVGWWERLIACYLEYVAAMRIAPPQRRRVYDVLLGIANGACQEGLLEPLAVLPPDAFETLEALYSSPTPLFESADSDAR